MNMSDEEVRQTIENYLNQQDEKFSKFFIIRHAHRCNLSCCYCQLQKDRIYEWDKLPATPFHPGCDCYPESVKVKKLGTVSDKGIYGPDVYLKIFNKLPDYYVTKEEAINKYGWNSRRNTVAGKIPGKMIGGDIFKNIPTVLPYKEGRIWYECDIDYVDGRRNSKRLYYSNDGLMFYSPGHLSDTDGIEIYVVM